MVHAHDYTHGTTDFGDVESGDETIGKLINGEFGAAADSFMNGDPQIAWDAKKSVYRSEHQASGLGVYANREMSENAYRSERNEIGLSGLGRDGDGDMPQRNRYNGFSPDFL